MRASESDTWLAKMLNLLKLKLFDFFHTYFYFSFHFCFDNIKTYSQGKKHGRARDVLGYPSLEPLSWPSNVPYISPNERRIVGKFIRF